MKLPLPATFLRIWRSARAVPFFVAVCGVSYLVMWDVIGNAHDGYQLPCAGRDETRITATIALCA